MYPKILKKRKKFWDKGFLKYGSKNTKVLIIELKIDACHN